MLWLVVLTLPDGSRVESNLVGVESGDTGLAERGYRLRLTDGSATEYSSLTSILQHLADVYDLDDLSRLASGDESLTSDLAAAIRVDLPLVSTAVSTSTIPRPRTSDDP
jgi:hypothetical protein